MSDLTEFLLARVAEDEAAAREATPGPWWNESGTVHAPFPFGRDLSAGPGGACHPLDAQGGNGRDADAEVEHAARWNPARVLAECEAKRLIVALHHPASAADHGSLSEGRCFTCVDFHADYDCEQSTLPCWTLRALAQPYAAHPDYRPEWRP